MNRRKLLLWTIPLLIVPSLLFTILLQRGLESIKQAGWLAAHLEDRRIKDIVFDPQHRAWVATNNGVSVFDGGDWTTYNAESDGLVGTRWINDLALDGQGRVWAATSRGLNVFDGARWITYTTENSGLVGNGIRSLTFDHRGGVWIRYERTTQGLSVFDGQTLRAEPQDEAWTTYTAENSGLVHNQVSTIAFDDQNRAWIGTWGGLSVFDGEALRAEPQDEAWTTYTTQNSGLLHDHIFTIAFDRQNRAWIGAEGELNVFDGQTWLSHPIDRTPVSGNKYGGPYVIAFDEQNRAWVGVHGGVNVLDAASGEMVLRDGEYTVGDVAFAQGQVWLRSTRSSDIRVFADGAWLDYTPSNSALPTSVVTAMAVDGEGRIWIGGRKGIRVVNPAEAQPLSNRAASVLRFLSGGGHLFLPIIVVGLWLGLWLDALPGVGVGIAVGLFIFLIGVVGVSGPGEIFLSLGCIGTMTGILGGLLGTTIHRRRKAAPSEEPTPAGDLAPPEASTVTGILGGVSGAIIGVVVVIVGAVLCCLGALFVMMKLGIGMQ